MLTGGAGGVSSQEVTPYNTIYRAPLGVTTLGAGLPAWGKPRAVLFPSSRPARGESLVCRKAFSALPGRTGSAGGRDAHPVEIRLTRRIMCAGVTWRWSNSQPRPIYGRGFQAQTSGQAYLISSITRFISRESRQKGSGYLHFLQLLASAFGFSRPQVAAINRFIRGFPVSQTERVSLLLDRTSFWHFLGASILNKFSSRDPGAGIVPVRARASTCPYTMTSRSLSSRGAANGGNAGGLSKVTGTWRGSAVSSDAKCFNI